jgi:putative transposase
VPWGLKRLQQTGHSHFVAFSCYRRQILFSSGAAKRSFESALERVRRSFRLRVYGYVVMPEHVHLLVSEPEKGILADALKSLKQERGLCARPQDWEWSSFRQYATGCEGRVHIECDWTARRREREAARLSPAVELPHSSQKRA